MGNPLFARKPLALLLEEMKGENRLRRVLGPVQLTALGVGAVIGTGIFVLTGVAAHDKTGPALMLSFVASGLACIFAALCYAEFASMAPVAGSAYTYAYATLGELFAWIIGWDLILEYAVASMTGAAVIFFAYIGFDSVSTHAEEARNPKKDVPIGIVASLVICTVLYIAVAAVLTGMVPYSQINIETPVSDAFRQAGLPWARGLISLGAMCGITSVLLVMMLSQPRVWLAMARDGMVPPSFFGAVHPRFRTPWKATILTGVFVALGAAFLPLRILADLTNIGTLFAFVVVCAAVLIMRRMHPDAERPFRAPLGAFVPIAGIL